MVKGKISDSLCGLVLAGGKSMRMGHDKGAIKWHGGEEQRYYLADLLSKYCDKVFISIRPEQKNEINSKYETIIDTHKDLGQYGAILSALEKFPDKAFLVVACDLPLFDKVAIEHLLSNRDPEKMATAYRSDSDGLPEPLAAIWEAKSKKRLLELLDAGITCPRKALIKSSHNVKLLKPLYSELTMNTNTPEEAKKAQEIINERVKAHG
jgi:molybdopterin-guanine dinucleotide biosynthesis protein A